MKKAKVIMIQGTMSNVGKSVITTGLCRILKEDGYAVAPFKSQNMSLNSFVTVEGLEMGRAQVVQAEACGLCPDVRMNPILLKPSSETGCQVIVHGEIFEESSALNYRNRKKVLKKEVMKAFSSLSEEFDVIVIEGAGSPAEINLNQDDFVNMGLAHMVDAPVILVGDIDRGGIFATLYGTINILPQEDKIRVKGVIINKFRGDMALLQDGLRQLEELISRPVLGVVPFLKLDIEEEDSQGLLSSPVGENTLIEIAVIQYPRMSNFTDFEPLSFYSWISLRYITQKEDLTKVDCILLPGSKNTIADLKWLREQKLDIELKKAKEKDVPIMGICGGYQMMGRVVVDEFQMEEGGEVEGLCWFPFFTKMSNKKTRTQVKGTVLPHKGLFSPLAHATFTGYEIHVGESVSEVPFHFSQLEVGEKQTKNDGLVQEGLLGTYVHGIFEEGDFCRQFLEILLKKKGILDKKVECNPYSHYKNQQYDQLAEALREALDMEYIYKLLEE